MKPPVNLVLYTATLACLGTAGHQFWHATPLLGAEDPNLASKRGLKRGTERLTDGREANDRASMVEDYSKPWWQSFREANFVGAVKRVEQPIVEIANRGDIEAANKPIADVVQVIAVLWDEAGGAGSKVMVRYLPDSGVQIPEEFLPRLPTLHSPLARPSDVSRPRSARPGRSRGPIPRVPQPAALTSLPGSTGAHQVVHHLVVGDTLWPPFTDVELVEVPRDALSVWFRRRQPAGDPGAEPALEEVVRSTLDVSQEALAALIARLRAQAGERPVQERSRNEGSALWTDVAETQRVAPGIWSISRKDAHLLRENTREFLDRVSVRDYRDSKGRAGVLIGKVDPAIGARFGVREGDVIYAVNGVPVKGQAHAIRIGKAMYNKGTRTFRVTILSYGRETTRTFYAPEK